MNRLILYLPCLLFAETSTILSQAEKISQLYSEQVAKASPPASTSLAEQYLQISSNWLEIDLSSLSTLNEENPLQTLNDPAIWQIFKDIGINAAYFKNLREKGQLTLDPTWRSAWGGIQEKTQKQKISLVGDLIGNSIPMGADFQEAIQNKGDYPNLFHLIEINPEDWNLLPSVPLGCMETNVPWLTLQELHKQGYVPEHFTPYVKESDWNATGKVIGVDGKTRRWIYLKEKENNPSLAWLSPSFTAYRLAAGDALGMCYELGEQMLQLDGKMPPLATSALSLWIRKIGAFSALKTDGTIASIANAPSDLMIDSATPAALLHALIAQNAEALRMIYRLFLENSIASKKLVHVLQPFEPYSCDWMELLHSPRKKFRYFEEQITGDILRQRLLKEDLFRLKVAEKLPQTTWVDYCARSLNLQNIEKNTDKITELHLLLAFAYAHQPGVFSVSLEDLLGAVISHKATLKPLDPNANCLYPSLPIQQKNPKSFVSQLSKILAARNESNIAKGELIAVPCSSNQGTLLLLHRLPSSRFLQLLALNFANKPVKESIECASIAQTTAIDLMTKLSEEKIFSSAQFSFNLAPLSGRVFYFQPKYYD